MPGEEELEGRDVPAAGAERERPAPEPGPAERAERPARLRPEDAVGGESGPALEGANGLRRGRAEDAVDCTRVDAPCVEGDLERSDLWIAHFIRWKAREMVWTPGMMLDYARALERLVEGR